ncbi:MAG: radical SAM protein, partial [Selenomonadaceae bacterium]|nr:radical SAM protein [Selenomonadaceae bacterium]
REENRTCLKDVVPLDTPYNIGIEVSSLCNARCVYCAHSKGNHGLYEGNMSMELFKKIIGQIREFPKKIRLIETYSFGEPLCNPHLEEMIEIIRKEDIAEKINFTTNGLLFNKKRTDALMKAGVDTIRISLQGLNADTYKKMCGVNMNFEEFLSNLRYLYENRGNCKIRMKIADIALKDEPDGEKKFEEMFGDIADSIFVEHILPIYGHVNYDEVDGSIKENALNGRGDVKQTEMHKVCHRPFYRLRVTADGKVGANCCDQPNDIIYGDLRKNSLKDLWGGVQRNSFLKMLLRGEKDKHPVCSKCVLANDITNERDLLDPWAEEILARMKR